VVVANMVVADAIVAGMVATDMVVVEASNANVIFAHFLHQFSQHSARLYIYAKQSRNFTTNVMTLCNKNLCKQP